MAEISTAAAEATETPADRYVIDGRSSRFTVQAFATGMLARMGHNPTIGIRDFSGEMKFNPDKLEAGAFHLVIKSASLSVQDDISDKDLREIERLMKQEVLETAKFPEIVYDAPSISVTKMADTLYSAALNGKLTLHGVTRNQPISGAGRVIWDACYGPPVISPWTRLTTTSNWFLLPGVHSS